MCCQWGADSDVILDMIIRCGGKDKTDFVFYDTGLEYSATHEHLSYLENKYGINIMRVKAKKSIPISIKEFGVPFLSKFASDMIHRLQSHGFKFEDEPYEELIARYPRCQTALRWWCNVVGGNTTQYTINRYKYLKEYMVENPPSFKISGMCCHHAKKYPAQSVLKNGGYDLNCLGLRKSEGGVRAQAYSNCFTQRDGSGGRHYSDFRPIFWLSDNDKDLYCSHYGVEHSRCYTEYGLKRTGCYGCPFGRHFEDELAVIEKYEPKLTNMANALFSDSYNYLRGYKEYKNKKQIEVLSL